MANNKYFQWYIATTLIGSEESLFTSLTDKIKAYDFEDHVADMKIITYKDIKIQYFDKNNPPPKSMKNSKYIKWEALEDGRYKKITTKVINKFPGYIFIKMIMTDKVWYIIRNTPGITGFIGSSGKGAKPIPISEYEIEDLFSSNNQDVITYVNGSSEDKKVSFETVNEVIETEEKNDEFYDSTKVNDVYDTVEEKLSEEIPSEEEIIKEDENVIEEENQDLGDIDFRVGHTVEILSGAFAGEKVLITNVDTENKTVTVEIDMFGRVNEVTLSFSEIKK